MSQRRILFGFHAVGVRLKVAPDSIAELLADPKRRDGRMRQFLARAQAADVPIQEADAARLTQLAGGPGHQGVVARVTALPAQPTLVELLEDLEDTDTAPLLLVLDGVTDPHNLGACLRVADGAGAQAVVAPRDHAASVNATVAKVASGAAESVPYFMVTNLARCLTDLKARGIRVIGAAGEADHSIYQADLRGPVALVLGAEGTGLRQLTRKTCDELVHIPMHGAVESLSVSVASGVCLYEALRQRLGAEG
jgi:23S rRNA (guanosine2251-2'-O)-methyltransferase